MLKVVTDKPSGFGVNGPDDEDWNGFVIVSFHFLVVSGDGSSFARRSDLVRRKSNVFLRLLPDRSLMH